MTMFSVWAPNASTVSVQVGGVDHPMAPLPDGMWTAEVPTAHEARYAFLLDGGPPRPDPRSRRQPDGVHEPSQLVDLGAYRWQDAGWRGCELAGSVIYELHIGTFTAEGTLDSAIERLDDLADLGVDAVELLPVGAFNGEWNWGYDGVAWFAVHEPYGGPAAYQRFVDACHQRGLAVIQDVVYNHLGPSGNYLSEFGPYLREDSSNTWGASVNLDGPGSDEVRRHILDNAAMWFADYHVDGLRLDAVHALVDNRALTLLEELAAHTDALAGRLGRPLSLIAESDRNDPRLITPRNAGGIGLTASWNDDVHHALHVAVTGETSGYYADFAPLSALAKVLRRGYFHDGTYSTFRQRHHGRPIDPEMTPPWRLVCSVQTHDQVGNRAIGDRIAEQAGVDAQAIAAVLLLTAPFTPMLFMGEEWAASTPWQFFTSHPESDLGEATRRGRFAEFAAMGWDVSAVLDPQDPETFRRSVLNWSERERGEHGAILALYRDLLQLRRDGLVSTGWEASIDYDEAARWLTVRRGGLFVAANLGVGALSLPEHDVDLLTSTRTGVRAGPDGGIHLPPRTAAVFAVRRASAQV